MSSAERQRRRAARRRAFTLLEVMAAVAVLGLVYTVLGSTGIQGLQREGEAERRIEASLLADQVLTTVEEAIDAGAPPDVGEQDSTQGAYTVAVKVQPYDLVVPEADLPKAMQHEQDRARRPGQARGQTADDSPSFLVGERGQVSPLRRVDVEVSWTEGWGERSVTRTTFGMDAQSVQASLEALDAASSAGAAGGAAPGGAPTGGTGTGAGGGLETQGTQR